MTKKAPPEMQAIGDTAEERIFQQITKALREAGSKLVVKRGSPIPRENGEYGDVQICASLSEAPLQLIEVKASTYPASFSLSDYEKRCSRAQWVVVEGSMGTWVVPMPVATQYLSEQVGSDGKYWVCRPPMDQWITFAQFIDMVRTRFGESTFVSSLGIFNGP